MKITAESKIEALGERAIISQFINPLLSSAAGNILFDDCAVIDIGTETPLLLTTDQGPERTFMELLGVGTPSDIAHFHVTANVSDIAAMGGRPFGMLLVLALPRTETIRYLEEYLAGLKAAMVEYGVSLFGGDTKQAKIRTTTITLLGFASKASLLRRKGAKAGDDIFVTGPPLGTALHSFIVAARQRSSHSNASVGISRPKAQVSFGQSLAASKICTTCMDMSDGLLSSAQQLAELNNVAFNIDFDKVPFSPSPTVEKKQKWKDLITNVGGDFGLLFTASPGNREQLARMGATHVGGVELGKGDISRPALERAGISFHPWEQFKTLEAISDEILSFV
jgi:thiamine-monophosphate kinase